MLLRFSFENFRTFREKTTLSMLATTQRTLNDVLIRKGKHRILPSAILYGANASGKSNVILAMQTLRTIVYHGSITHATNRTMSALELFPFIHDGNAEPIAFEIEFIAGDDRFVYLLSVAVESLKVKGKRYILEEKLDQVLPKDTIMLFHRTKDDIVIGSDRHTLSALGYESAETLKGLVSSVVQNMDEETLFLTGGFKSTIRKPVADKIIGYITDNVLAMMNMTDLLLDDSIFISTENAPNDVMITDRLFDVIIKAADFGPQKVGWRVKDKGSGKQGVSELEMISKYRNSIIPSEVMESAGTIRLLRFSILLRQVLENGSLLMIDEMDHAIHPEIMKGIIAVFSNPEVNKNGAQLIFTSHNPIFMDHDLLRRDQILFTERDPDTFTSTLHSLGDFGSVSVRNDQSFIRNYFKGRYGRLPYLDLEAILTHGMEN